MRTRPTTRRLLTTALLAAGLPLTLAAGPAHAADVRCGGRVPTIVGTDGNDHLVGTKGPDVIIGRGGRDEIDGRGGDDVICGGRGADVLLGGAGDDQLWSDRAGVGRVGDLLAGGPGDDRLDLSASVEGSQRRPPSTFSFESARRGVHVDLRAGTATGQGHDTLVLPPPARRSTYVPDVGVTGSPYDDVISGSDGADRLAGGAGDDVVQGRAGDDTLRAEALNSMQARTAQPDDDLVVGGAGRDSLTSFTGVDQLDGGAGDDLIYAPGGGARTVRGGAGDDVVQAILPHSSFSSYDGGSGRDQLWLSSKERQGQSPLASLAVDQVAGTSTAVNGDGTSYVGGVTGYETYTFLVKAPVTFTGDDESTVIWSLGGPLDASMGAGDDEVHGSAYDDRLDGGDGTDRVWPSEGTDTCTSFEDGSCS